MSRPVYVPARRRDDAVSAGSDAQGRDPGRSSRDDPFDLFNPCQGPPNAAQTKPAPLPRRGHNQNGLRHRRLSPRSAPGKLSPPIEQPAPNTCMENGPRSRAPGSVVTLHGDVTPVVNKPISRAIASAADLLA
ncbi:hypothetical protein Bbelb_182760 [Branchiostoma belcheri]|nr:hypothetical protein Bbelb_182760 [Branchiostoma belcheri]